MRTRHPAGSLGKGRFQVAGLSLLEVIGILAVIAIFTAVLLRSLIREIDQRYVREERAGLILCSESLVRAILRNGVIPNETGWASLVASDLGADTNRIARNSRRLERLLLIDGGGWFSSVSLPYTNTYLGTASQPAAARLMLVSSVSKPLTFPAGLTLASDFVALWNWSSGALPSVSWSWGGLPADDLMVERIDLTPRFLRLYLATFRSLGPGQFGIGLDANIYPTTVVLGGSYYLENTAVRLYHSAAAGSILDTTHILIRDASFMYQDNIWKSSSAGGMMPGGLDIAGAVNQFLTSTPNLYARSNVLQQRLIIQSMINYMSNYILWSRTGFVDATMKNYLINQVQPDMLYQVQGIFMKEQSSDYYPRTNPPCQ